MMRRAHCAIAAAILFGLLCGHLLLRTAAAAAKPQVTMKRGIRIFAEPDNSLCFVCHIDFAGEELTAQHLRAGVTCTSCHGDCAAHMSDEMSGTKPDLLYGRAEVEPLCRKCHSKHTSPEAVEAFTKKWEGKHLPNGRFISGDSPCTDCHGKHVIPRADLAAGR